MPEHLTNDGGEPLDTFTEILFCLPRKANSDLPFKILHFITVNGEEWALTNG